MSRLKNSAKNILGSFGNNFVASLLGLISRTVFIYTLGADYLGLSGLLSNVLGFLAIGELGIATAIGFSLYKPLAEKDYKSISTLMSVYRKAYSVIGVIVLLAGIILFQFLDFFVPVEQQPDGTTFAYFAFLINTVIGYFLSYKTTLISSDNQAFRLIPINVSINCVQTLLQIIALLIWKSYIVYLTIQIGCSIVLMAAQNLYITKKYENVPTNELNDIPKSIEENGVTYYLVNPIWNISQVEKIEGQDVPIAYDGEMQYEGIKERKIVKSYLATVTYIGTLEKEEIESITFNIKYKEMPQEDIEEKTNYTPIVVATAGTGILVISGIFLWKRKKKDKIAQ